MPAPDLHHTTTKLAQMLAFHCVRNSYLEDLHAGLSPSSKTGDYTDVKVMSPYGEIAWNRLGRISDEEKAVERRYREPALHLFVSFIDAWRAGSEHAAPDTLVTTSHRGLHCGDVARGEKHCKRCTEFLTL